MKLSASIILKNESKDMEKMLQSLAGFDEIVIVDTGSVDNTVEIAHKYTDKVFTDYQWADDFAAARNHALSKCTGDWILSIDGDEYLEVPIQVIRNAIEKADQEGFQSIQCNLIGEVNNNLHYAPRLFKRDPNIYFVGAIHEILNIVQSNRSNIQIRYGSSAAHEFDPERNIRILKKEVENNPSSPRELFYLAREYWYKNDYVTALEWYDKYLAIGDWYPEMAEAALMAAYCAWYTNQGDRARLYALQAIGFVPDFKEAYELMSEMYYEPRKSVWKKMAENAQNQDVLFIRKK